MSDDNKRLAWDKMGTVVMWSAVAVGALGITLIVPDASSGLRIVAAIICAVIAAYIRRRCANG